MRFQARRHKTVMFMTHDLDEALRLGDRIAIMRDGRSSSRLAGGAGRRPGGHYVREFVRDIPRSHVLTAAFAVQPHTPGETPQEFVQHDQRLGELLPVVFGAQGPIGVVGGGGAAVGILDRRMVIHVLAGREGVAVPEEPFDGDQTQP